MKGEFTHGKPMASRFLGGVKSAFVSPFKRRTRGLLIVVIFVVDLFAEAGSPSFEPPGVVRGGEFFAALRSSVSIVVSSNGAENEWNHEGTEITVLDCVSKLVILQ